MTLVAQLIELDAGDARSAVRRMLCLATPAHSSRGTTTALIHDLSEHGLRIEADAPFFVDELIGIELPEAGSVEARIVWVGQGYAGCRFLQSVSRATVSAALLLSPASSIRETGHEPELPLTGVVHAPPAERPHVEVDAWPPRTSRSLTVAALIVGLAVTALFILFLLVLALRG